MKILILANFDVGLYQFRKETIERLLTDNEVVISLPYGKLVDPLCEMGCRFVDTPMERRGLNPFRDLSLFFRYLHLLSKEKPDKVLAYTIKPNIYGGLACRIKKIPYYSFITGLGSIFQSESFIKKMVTVMYRTGIKKASRIFFENAENLRIFEESGISDTSHSVLLNGAGVNLEHYKVSDYPAEPEVGFLYMGRVMKEKGIDELFSAMKRLRAEGYDCVLDVLGIPEEDHNSAIGEGVSEGWLRFHGFQEDVRPFIGKAHCFVLPSWHEGMANTNLEAAASGRPVITSNIPGCREAVIDGESGFLCEAKDSGSLYEAMKRFILLPHGEKEAMGIAGRHHMEEVFDKKKVVEETIKHLFI